MIKVLVVEDSATVREFLVHLLSSDPELRVVGTASDGEEALDGVRLHRPDVITMDINMPRLNGFEATRRIMETVPTPIIIVSGAWDVQEQATSFLAMEAGALALLRRPHELGHPNQDGAARELLQTVKLMAEVKVVRRWPRTQTALGVAAPRPGRRVAPRPDIQAVAIGASTGGPAALHTLVAALPRPFPVPVLLVQHLAASFAPAFAGWLTRVSGFPVALAADGEQLAPDRAYLAPDDCHLGVQPGPRILLSRDPPEHGLRPAVSFLFRSVGSVYRRHAVGILLTGMGQDGAEELKQLKDQGAVTLVQDKDSSVVFGMPGEAVRLQAASQVLPPAEIAAALGGLLKSES